LRHGAARYLIRRVGRQTPGAPGEWAAARLEAEYAALK
jgi:hypothetical protein